MRTYILTGIIDFLVSVFIVYHIPTDVSIPDEATPIETIHSLKTTSKKVSGLIGLMTGLLLGTVVAAMLFHDVNLLFRTAIFAAALLCSVPTAIKTRKKCYEKLAGMGEHNDIDH